MMKARWAACCSGSFSNSAISKLLHAGGILVPFIVAEIVIDGPGRQDQVVVGHRLIPGVDTPGLGIDSRDLGQHDKDISLVAQNGADGLRDVGGRKRRGGHLVQKWLKQMVVIAIDYQHFRRRMPQCAGGEQSAETAANNEHTGPAWRPQYQSPADRRSGR
jgi:hypothetical protein